MESRRPTQKDIAALAGVHYSVVCRALQNHPCIPATTRDRVQKIAEEIGYRPDPALSALAAYRSSLRPPAFQGQLAWLTSSEPGKEWNRVDVFLEYMQSATAQAARQGYNLVDYGLDQPSMTTRRLASIMKARNVRGILICPQPDRSSVIDLPWENFSAVTLGHALTRPHLHVVSADHYRSTRLIIHKLRQLGYRRIGLAMPSDLNIRLGGDFLAAYLLEQHALPESARLEAYLDDHSALRSRFAAWLRKAKPDVVITTHYTYPEYLVQLGMKIPDDIGVAVLFKKIHKDDWAGIDQSPQKVAVVATNILVSMIQRNECGAAQLAQHIKVEGTWFDGWSVRQVGPPV
jgi:LacI family transcriptional regulator